MEQWRIVASKIWLGKPGGAHSQSSVAFMLDDPYFGTRDGMESWMMS